MFTFFDFLFWLAFGISITPGLGTGFFGFLFAMVFGFILACIFEWLSVQLLVKIPERLFPLTNTIRPFWFCIENAIGVFFICLLIGVLVFDRWISDMAIGYFFGKYAPAIVPQ